MSTPIRILLVEDSVNDAELLLRELRALNGPIESERVEDAETMRAALERQTWDAVLSDWSMPNFSALGALAVLKRMKLDLPFIIVSGTIGEEMAIRAMRAGAHDFISKGKLARLIPAIERELRESEDRRARRDADEALLIHQARLRALVEKSEDGISLTASDGTVFYMSPAAERILGATVEDRKSVTDVAHTDDRAGVAEAMRRLLENPLESVPMTFRAVRPDGSMRWIEAVATNFLKDPTIRAVVSNFRDVTGRKDTLGELRASEARYRRMIETANEGVWMIDAGSKTTFMNARMAVMLGYEVGEVQGMSIFDFLPQDGRASSVEELARRREGLSGQFETALMRKDATELSTLVSATPVFDAAGRYEGALAFVLDQTERKRTEEALRRSEAQLRQAQKMEAVGRLAGGVAHDFNNLLSIIMCLGDLMLAELASGDPMRSDLEEIRAAAMRAADLTRQLLTFSRQQLMEPRVINLNDVLTSMDSMLHRILGEDVDLVSLAGPSLGHVKVDPGSIEQVIMNLAVNARDAMPTGGKLTMETANVRLDEAYASEHLGVIPGPHVMLAVTDSGTGMDKATQARMFEPFFTTKETGKGTGLGLATVFGIVQQSGGSIWVYSEEGKGTTFKVYFPRVGAALETIRPAPTSVTLRGWETILLVEDEEQVRAVAKSVLRKYGYNVVEARNAGEALLLCEKHTETIHLLVSDVVMPQMSGPELAKRLSAARPEMRVLCMSGYTDDSIVRHGVLESEMAFLQKPFTPQKLTRKVREVLDEPSRRVDATTQ